MKLYIAFLMTLFAIKANKNENLFEVMKEADHYRKTGDIQKAKSLYESAASKNSSEALNSLGEIFLRGEYESEINYQRAEQYFKKGILFKNEKSIYNLAFMARFGLINGNEDEIEVNLYLAASLNSNKATLALGHKHLYGYGVPNNCDSAYKYYADAATKILNTNENQLFPHERTQISLNPETQNLLNPDSIDIIKMRATEGDPTYQLEYATILLGKYDYLNIPQNAQTALRLLRSAASKNNAKAQELLGKLHLKGIHVEQDYAQARYFFSRAAETGSISANNRIAEMHLKGIGGVSDLPKAKAFYKKAAAARDAEGLFYTALLHTDHKDESSRMLAMAASMGFGPALLEVAKVQYAAPEMARSCFFAVSLLKVLAEKDGSGRRESGKAFERYRSGDLHHSLLLYMDLALQGHEAAQANAAFILEAKSQRVRNFGRKLGIARHPLLASLESELRENPRALGRIGDEESREKVWKSRIYGLFEDPYRNSKYHFLSLSSDQNNAESKRKLGDYHYLNSGTDSDALLYTHQTFYLYKALESADGVEEGGERLVTAYQLYKAASGLNNSQATFNMAYMRQFGIGRKQDLKLAKRFYHISLEQDKKSAIPTKIFTIILWFQERAHLLQRFGLIFKAVEEWTLLISSTMIVAILVYKVLKVFLI